MREFDAVFVGGGLANSLCVLALLARRPDARLALVESGPRLGGNHTWCYHAADLPPGAEAIVAPLAVRRWPGYTVRFPDRARRVDSPYACISSERLHDVVSARLQAAPGCALLLDATAVRSEPTRVQLADGRELAAPLIVEALGPRGAPPASAGYQKFLGLELEVEGAPPSEPLLIDACVPQHDGFRFMYVLPLAPDRVLIEETFFSERPELDEAESARAIHAYAEGMGLTVRKVLREERGVLPMPWRDPDFDLAARPLQAGYGAGLFHPVTGYSFPLAIRFALALASSDPRSLERSPLAAFARSHAAQRPFLRLLARLLFKAFSPSERFRVLEHFYRLPAPVIERFYAAELRPLDRARIFFGPPPRGFSLIRVLRPQGVGGVAP